jgi:glycosyltransferase involved in cell wall biosynthesis
MSDTRKLKILFAASYPNQPIGYSKIANILSNFLVSQGVDLYYFGFSNYADTVINRFIDPRIKFIDVIAEEAALNSDELYGVNIIEREMNRIQPDILFIYNDIVVTCRLMNALINYRKENRDKYKTFVYLDLVYDYEKPLFVNHINNNCDHIFVFTDYWKKNLIDMNISASKITILYHGCKPPSDINKLDARAKLGLAPTDFIILNTNRNSYRKAWDITIRAFLLFLKKNFMNPIIKLYINCYINVKNGYDILSIIETECIRLKLDFKRVTHNHILQPAHSLGKLEDSMIPVIYSAADIGINTCIGEGFGLCNAEQAVYGIPQIVSSVGGLKDVFKDKCICVEPVTQLLASNALDEHNGYMNICRAEDFAEAFDIYYKDPDRRREDGEKIRDHINVKYNWDRILSGFWINLLELL